MHHTSAAIDALRNGRFDHSSRLAQVNASSPECNEMQDNARGRDEGGGMNDEQDARSSSSLPPLNARQLTAINLLMLGKTVTATAASIKVDPSTIHRWKATNPHFIAELNRRQHDAFDQIVTKLRMAMGRAVDELLVMLESNRGDYRREVMWAMLKLLRPQTLIKPVGPTDARDVIDQKIREARSLRGEIVEAPIEEEDRIAWVDGVAQGATRDQPLNCERDVLACGTGLRHVNKVQSEGSHERDAHATKKHEPGARATNRTPRACGTKSAARVEIVRATQEVDLTSSTAPASPAGPESERMRSVSERAIADGGQSTSADSLPTERTEIGAPSTNTSNPPSTR